MDSRFLHSLNKIDKATENGKRFTSDVKLESLRSLSHLWQPPKRKMDGAFPVSGRKWMNKDMQGGR